ncbi:type IV pilus assembly protein PilM [Desulfoplanes sp.]
MIPFLQKKTTSCGLDLGTSWVKMVCLRKNKQGFALERIGHMTLPAHSRGDAKGLGAAVKTLHSSAAVRDRVVVSSLRGHEVIVKYLQLPLVKDMRGAVEKEAKEQIPFDLNDLYLDFQAVTSGEKKAKRAEVMVVATKKKVVNDLEAAIGEGGLSLAVVDVDAFALSNCFGFNYPEYSEPTYLLDIGGAQSILGVYEPGHPFYFREIDFGGQQITRVIARYLDIPMSEAEAVKFKGATSLPPDQSTDIQSSIQEACRNWCREIKRMEHFYQTSTSISSIPKQLFVSGGASLLPGVPELLGEGLGITVSYLNPWRKIEVDTNQFDSRYTEALGPQFVVSTGLALRGGA